MNVVDMFSLSHPRDNCDSWRPAFYQAQTAPDDLQMRDLSLATKNALRGSGRKRITISYAHLPEFPLCRT